MAAVHILTLGAREEASQPGGSREPGAPGGPRTRAALAAGSAHTLASKGRFFALASFLTCMQENTPTGTGESYFHFRITD